MQVAEQWVPLVEAARKMGISASKLSGMARRGEVQSRKDPKDKRKVLVDLAELRKLFYPNE
jgi:hypothetical protein